jgi:folate-binding protein YgfZ
MNRSKHATKDDRADHTSPHYFPRAEVGYLQISDRDRSDFLQRQTTNDLRALKPGKSLTTVLTSATARILDVLTLLDEGEAIVALPLPRRTDSTARFLQGKIFFMDKVAVDDLSSDYFQLDLEGAAAGERLLSLGLTQIPEKGQEVKGEVAGISARALGHRGLDGKGYRLIVPRSGGETLISALEAAGVARMTPEEREVRRVEAGLPAVDHELTDRFTPLEVGLQWAVSGDKGCYTGQEILARQITYDKVTRKMVGLKLDDLPEEGDKVLVEGSSAGSVTSVVKSPRFGAIALAVIKRPHNKPGTEVAVGEDEIPARVNELPFAG